VSELVGDIPPVGSSVLASWLNMTPRRVQQLAKDGTIPKRVDGLFDLKPAVLAYLRFATSAEDDSDDGAELAKIKLERQRIALQREQLDLHRDAGALVAITDAGRVVGVALDAMTTTLQTMPRLHGVDAEDRARLKAVCVTVANEVIAAVVTAVESIPVPVPALEGNDDEG
jgi:hypothetical protein